MPKTSVSGGAFFTLPQEVVTNHLVIRGSFQVRVWGGYVGVVGVLEGIIFWSAFFLSRFLSGVRWGVILAPCKTYGDYYYTTLISYHISMVPEKEKRRELTVKDISVRFGLDNDTMPYYIAFSFVSNRVVPRRERLLPSPARS